MGKQIEAKKAYSIMIRPSVADEYERLAKKLVITRSQLMSNALEIGLSDIHVMEACGVVHVVGGVQKMKEIMKDWRDRQDAIAAKA